MKAIKNDWDLAKELQNNPGRFTPDDLADIGKIIALNAEIIENYKKAVANYEKIVAMKVDCPHKEQCPGFWAMEKE